jgi:folate-binding protein YgfZ
MTSLALREFHLGLGAAFADVNGAEVVAHYGDALAEHAALRQSAGILDLCCRSRLCLTGADRGRFLNGQVTNNVKDLKRGEGCYAALVTAKGKMQSDLNIYCLADELWLDFEPGFRDAVVARFEKFIIADDVQVVDATSHYGLLSVQGPNAGPVVHQLGLGLTPPERPLNFTSVHDSALGEIYCANHPRTGLAGFDLFAPVAALNTVADKLIGAAKATGGRACGWAALEVARIEAGIPRFGADMDETNLAPEAGIEARAISYTKGCYIGQEVIARLRTYGQVAKSLRGLLLPDEAPALPHRGDKLFHGDKEAGYITSALASPTFRRHLALGYVRREHSAAGSVLHWRGPAGERAVTVTTLPFSEAALC